MSAILTEDSAIECDVRTLDLRRQRGCLVFFLERLLDSVGLTPVMREFQDAW